MVAIRTRAAALVLAIAVAVGLVTVVALAMSAAPHDGPEAVTQATPTHARSDPPAFATQRDAMVDAAVPTNDLTTYYPVVDGYRDRIKTSGELHEPGSVTVEAWNDVTNQKVWTSGPFETSIASAYSVTWNGESTAGVVVQAGTYRFRHVLVDVYGNTTALSSPTFKVSRKTIVWHTFSTTTIQGKAYESKRVGGGALAEANASIYAGGIRLDSRGGYATLTYKVHLSRVATPSNAVLRKLIFTINGKGAAQGETVLGIYNRTLGSVDDVAAYDRLTTTAPTPGWHPTSTYYAVAHLVGQDAYGRVEAHGIFDIDLVKVTLRYAVLR